MPVLLPSMIDRLEAHEVPPEYDPARLRSFIDEAKASGGAELANAQSIFRLLCESIKVPAPSLKKSHGENSYVFEEDVKEEEAHRRIDVYKRACFVFEAKQGVDKSGVRLSIVKLAKSATGHSRTVRGAGVRGTPDWVDAMRSGRHQAGNYAVHVAKRGDPKPPFLIVADVGHCFWIWSSFTRDAKDDYGDFEPTAAFSWDSLERPEVVKLLRQIWLNPEALNEDVLGQRVTAEIAGHIGDLAMHLERRFDAERVGDFLMKCVFTMFAEDVEFLPLGLFTKRLQEWIEEIRQGKPSRFVKGLKSLWLRMRDGGDLDSGHVIKRFNGYLFRDPEPLDLQLDELTLLALAATRSWRRVSPAIFGTLLERALEKGERQRLGAHYTPETYIQRLVTWTVMEPLRGEWTTTRAQMELIVRRGNDRAKAEATARKLGHIFRKRLASIRVLDPACGSGNFLYVALKEMKRLEGEVVRALVAMGDKQTWLDIPGDTVHPSQFFGVEIKPWAAKIAELVLWIGYLQWQVSVGRLEMMPEPILQDLKHIETGDALITWAREEKVLDEGGQQSTRASGVTDKKATRSHIGVTRLVGVKVSTWPAADFVVGNPPFIGNKKMMDLMGSGYAEAIRAAFPNVPGSADLVMFWWWRAADLLHRGEIRRFGFVTTSKITQTLNRPVVTEALEEKGLKVIHAIADHPWYDEGAAVRIAMTVADREASEYTLGVVVDETKTKAGELDAVVVTEKLVSAIEADLSSGAKVRSTRPLQANSDICFQGFTLVGEGFRLDQDEVTRLGVALPSPVVKPYLIGDYITQRHDHEWVIDFHGLSDAQAHVQYPTLCDHVVRTVKPQRERQNDKARKKNWWLFGRSGKDLRQAIAGIPRYIATSRTAKHRVFVFVPSTTLPDTKVVAVALDDAAFLAVLSSRVHVTWATRAGGRLGVGNDPTYNHTEAFLPFPFPSWTSEQRDSLRNLGERLEAHRRACQKAHPSLTITDIYNVVEKIRAGSPLTAEETRTRDDALAHTLVELHDEIDAVTLGAYDWPQTITADEVLERVVGLSLQRTAEEQRGEIRWLRPTHQAQFAKAQLLAPTTGVVEAEIGDEHAPHKTTKLPWPTELPSRIRLLTSLLRRLDVPVDTKTLAKAFKGARLDDVELTLRCAAAADAVVLVEELDVPTRWAARE